MQENREKKINSILGTCLLPLRSTFYLSLKRHKSKETPEVSELSHLIDKLHIHNLDDWYDVPKLQIKLFDGKANLLKKYSNVEAIVKAYYPKHKWDHDRFVSLSFTPQAFMRRIIVSLFPAEKIITNMRKGHDIRGDHGRPLEIDIFLPSLSLGFEYQDPHHYFHSIYGNVQDYQRRDALKMKQAAEQGITLIPIPFWWDWSVDSLVATIKDKRKELLTNFHCGTSSPLTEIPPPKIAEKYSLTNIPGLGTPMLAEFMPYASSADFSNMLIFEKYDGIRAIWNSDERTMYSRWGKSISLPPSLLTDILPSMWLDGEIWFGRERGARYLAIKLANTPQAIPWNRLKLMIFDTPSPALRSQPYLSRYIALSSCFESKSEELSQVELATYQTSTGRNSIESIRSKMGEGIILRDPNSEYISGYSSYLYKSKGFYDSEALVLQKISPTRFLCRVIKHGKHIPSQEEKEETKIETAEIEIPIDEKNFDGEEEDIVPGTFISYKYNGDSPFGLPITPAAIRNDITNWEQLAHSKRKVFNHQPVWKSRVNMQWTKMEQRREFFINYAKDLNFDPFLAENWYNISSVDVNRKGGGGLLVKYNNSLVKTLIDVFPEIGLKAEKFKILPKHHYENKDTLRQFFDDFAASKNFDPLVPTNWYNITAAEIKKNAPPSLLAGKSHSSLLIEVYPFIGLEKQKFVNAPRNFWASKDNRKLFFDQFAASKGFDPLKPDNWNVTYTDIKKAKGSRILDYYSGSLAKALLDIYPSIGWNEKCVVMLPLYKKLYNR